MDEDNKKAQPGREEGGDWVADLLREVEEENREEEAPPEIPQKKAEPQRSAAPNPEDDDDFKPRRRRSKRIRVKRKGVFYSFLYVIVSLAICAAATVFCLNAVQDVLAISKPDQAVTVTIPKDASPREIGKILKEDGLIRYPFVFELVAKFERYVKFEGGTHILNNNMDYMTLMKSMQKPKTVRETVRVTIPEGLPAKKIAELLDENGVCDESDFLLALQNTQFDFDYASEIPSDGKVYRRLEGYLFPDTYEFYKNDTALNVISRMLNNFEKKITPEIQAGIKKSGLSFHEVMTLASIIQGEAPDTENMHKVSAVYLNRLHNPAEYPLLQADPTRKYANEQILAELGDEGKKMAAAYNTYEGKGLPPGPINNPGVAAIQAAVAPSTEMEGYYYFCSDLKTREFFYAQTLDEHERNLVKAHLR